MRKILKVVVVIILISVLIAPASVILYSINFNKKSGEPSVKPAPKPNSNPENVYKVTLPFKEGDEIILHYFLKFIIGNTSRVVDNRTVKLVINSIEPPYLNTSIGLIPIAFIHPIRDKLDPHFIFKSLYLKDNICMELSLVGNRGDAYPKKGCTRYFAFVTIQKNGLLDNAKLILPSSEGVMHEEVYLVSYTSSGNTTVEMNRLKYICFGSASPNIYYTAPGMYLYNGTRIFYYTGKLDLNVTKPLIILYKDDEGNKIWKALISSRTPLINGTLIYVSSTILPVNDTYHNTLLLNGKIVARGDDILDWLENNGKQ